MTSMESIWEQGRRAMVAQRERLAELAEEIKSEDAKLVPIVEQALTRIVRNGNRLIEAKRLLDHGEYLPWVEQTLGYTRAWAAVCVNAANAEALWLAHCDGDRELLTVDMEEAGVRSAEGLAKKLPILKAGGDPMQAPVPKERKAKATPAQTAFKEEGADARIAELEEALAVANARIAELEAELANVKSELTFAAKPKRATTKAPKAVQ